MNTPTNEIESAHGQKPVVFYQCSGCGAHYADAPVSQCDCLSGKGFLRLEYFTYPDYASAARITELEQQNAMLLGALKTFIDEHEEIEDADGWMAFMCSPEAFHSADEALEAVKGSKPEPMTDEQRAGLRKALDAVFRERPDYFKKDGAA